MRIFLCCFSVLLLMGCKKDISSNDLHWLNGYWEIEKVEFPGGQIKEYTISSSIDFIALEKMEGYRKKVYPQFNGKYKTSNDAEMFIIKSYENHFLMQYKEGTHQRDERLVALEKNSFSVKNSDDKIYYYKRYEPLNLTP